MLGISSLSLFSPQLYENLVPSVRISISLFVRPSFHSSDFPPVRFPVHPSLPPHGCPSVGYVFLL